jgi:TPR repeat protein
MRTSNRLAYVLAIGLGLGLASALAFDGSPSESRTPTPTEAFRYGAQALKQGDKEKALSSLQYAAEQGHALAQWKLARMYAEGDGVPQDDLRAFDYYTRIANSHADDNPQGPQARFVASAFVALGHYYLEGIANTRVKADPVRAREMFSYAASYFSDADAQYYLARMYLDGVGAGRDPKLAVRWLGLAAAKGQCQAQAQLGAILFKGENVPRQAARGLMWLTLARDNGCSDAAWVNDFYQAAFTQATADERELGLHYLERWLKGRRD